jgi:hypothetical protein
MKRIKVPKGEMYGELTVIHESTSTPRRKFWCVCSCGNKTEVRLDHLRSGHTSSCGRRLRNGMKSTRSMNRLFVQGW